MKLLTARHCHIELQLVPDRPYSKEDLQLLRCVSNREPGATSEYMNIHCLHSYLVLWFS